MITGHIQKLEDLNCYPEAIREAVTYLKNTDFLKMETGVYELKGKDMFVQVIDLETADAKTKKPEVHKEYLDVQFLASGAERIGFSVDLGMNKISDVYNKQRDILFYEECENESYINMMPGNFAVFFPSTVHRPACNPEGKGNTKIRKIVIKVHTKLLNR